MPLPSWHEARIAKKHRRAEFDCGDPDLNDYLRRYARQNDAAGVANAYLAVPDNDPWHILGFYTATAAEISCDEVPPDLVKAAGRYPVPCMRLGRLAVDRRYHRMGLGGQLLLSAGERALRVSNEMGLRAVVIDAKHEAAAAYYRRFGAVRLTDASLTLVWPLATVRAALEEP